jgi:para-nitrobenzyl esterase
MNASRTSRAHALAAALLALAAACTNRPAESDAAMDATTLADGATDAAADALTDVAADTTPAVPITVSVSSGPVVGRDRGAYAEFLGIPYAAPPVGPLRFRPPAPVAPWTAPRDASSASPRCPQGFDPLSGSGAASEDCLTLNVYAPRGFATASLPVMVWIHGGGFNTGVSTSQVFHGGHFAADGQVVFVSFNYRLGPLGFFAHPALEAEDTAHHSAGNYGFLDQIAALQWVHDNIRAFGGDPARVTLSGESAGSMSTCGHLVSPLSRGLFQQAIMESGTCSYLGQPLHDDPTGVYESGEAFGLRIAAAVGCAGPGDVAACLRAKTPDELVAATPQLEALRLRSARFWPVVDGYVFPEPPWQAVTATPPRVADVPVMLGTNREEADLLILNSAVDTPEQYQTAAGMLFGTHGDAAQLAYPLSDYATPRLAVSAMYTDVIFTCATRVMARDLAAAGRRVFLYEFTRINPGARILGVRATHGFEIPYVFRNFVPPFRTSATDDALGLAMNAYWARFVATGSPNDAAAPVAWPEYSPAQDAYLDLGDTVQPATGPRTHRCDAIAPWIYPI